MQPFGYHPNLTAHAESERKMYGISSTDGPGTSAQVYGDIDNTPKTVFLIGLGALAIIYGLDLIGFRFAIGVGK